MDITLDNPGVHLQHCYQGEYIHACKYGQDNCPARIEYSEEDKFIIAVAAGIRNATPLARSNFRDMDESTMQRLAMGAIKAMKKFQGNYRGKHDE